MISLLSTSDFKKLTKHEDEAVSGTNKACIKLCDAPFLPFGGNFGASDIVPWLKEQGVRFLSNDQANKMNHDQLFDLLVTHLCVWNTVDPIPKISGDLTHYLIPFSFEDQEEISFNGQKLSELIESKINETLRPKKFIASCDPRHLIAVEIPTFSYDIVSSLAQNGGANTHFIIFDEGQDFWVTLCPEFPFIVISKREPIEKSELFGKNHSFWTDYFNKNISQAARLCSPDFLDMLKTTYISRVLRLT